MSTAPPERTGPGRRSILTFTGGALVGVGTAGLGVVATRLLASPPPRSTGTSATPAESLTLLREGNGRWASGRVSYHGDGWKPQNSTSVARRPHSVIIGCADARIAPELVFDQDVNDLFVVRTSGHTVTPGAMGSIQFGVVADTAHRTPLVVVLGHEGCQVVDAAITARGNKAALPGAIQDVIAAVFPAVDSALAASKEATGPMLAKLVALAHVTQTVARLRADRLLSPLVEAGSLGIVGAYYELTSGHVNFLD